MYPLENAIFTLTSDSSIINRNRAKEILPSDFIRKIRIEYQWISDSTLKYVFESEWKYNIDAQVWDVVYQKAN
jgi:hypothetical protein